MSYGLFAIGIYVGEVSAMNNDILSDLRLNYTCQVLIDINKDENRFFYGMGIHIANDGFHYPNGYDHKKKINIKAGFTSNLAVMIGDYYERRRIFYFLEPN